MILCSIEDWFKFCLLWFDDGENVTLHQNLSDYTQDNPIRKQPTGQVGQNQIQNRGTCQQDHAHQQRREHQELQAVLNCISENEMSIRELTERCKSLEEQNSKLRNDASNHQVEVRRLEEDNTMLQEQCTLYEEQMRKQLSDANNIQGRNRALEEDNNLLEKKCNAQEEHNSKLYHEANNLKAKIRKLEEDRKLLQEKVDAWYVHAAQSMTKSGTLENTNDKYSNTRLAERFDGKVKDSWLDMCDLLNDVLTEWERVKALSRIIKNISTKCTEKADADIQSITCSSEVDEMDMNTLIDIRRRCGQTESKMEAVVKEMADSVWSTKDVLIITEANPTDETIQSLHNFIHDVIQICWLMAISQPPMMLNFEVEGSMYTPQVKERFTEYSTEDSVESNDMPGTILLVVWPTVEKRNKSGFLKKGEVIVRP